MKNRLFININNRPPIILSPPPAKQPPPPHFQNEKDGRDVGAASLEGGGGVGDWGGEGVRVELTKLGFGFFI